MQMDVVLGSIDIGLLLPPLLLFEEARVTRIMEATVSTKHARRFILRFNLVRIL